LLDYDNNCVEVLIVEDEMVLAIGMEASLIDLGYEVSGIESTAENAIKHSRENYPDVVLMDINLVGEKSGIDAAMQIWQNQKIPIIFLTSYIDKVTVKHAMLSEPYAYLVKPCRDKELDIAIKTALHKHKYFFKNKECFQKESIINLVNNSKYDKGKKILYHNNEPLKLTGNEIKFFDILSQKNGESVSFERIISYIYRDNFIDRGKLRTLIYRLRDKIPVDLFENVYEFGYRLKVA
jgi:DNA-binding response OmpR family regulator